MSLLDQGTNRIGFALFDTAGKQLTGAGVALYIGNTDGSGRPRAVRRPQRVAEGLAAVREQADGDRPERGARRLRRRRAVQAQRQVRDARDRASSTGGWSPRARSRVQVGGKKITPPAVGQKAPIIHTLTPTDVAGDLAKIDTRVPPAPSLLKDDFADVVGKKPVVLTFATPQLCQSRVCGPVVDVVDEVQAKVGDKVSFIHQEVYQDNQVNKGLRPQLQTYRLQTEPWTFVIDRNGGHLDALRGRVLAGRAGARGGQGAGPELRLSPSRAAAARSPGSGP